VSPVRSMPTLAQMSDAPYRLGAGDTLQIIVFGEADFSGTFRVSDSGAVAMPLIGAVPADGLTVEQFQKVLLKRLDEKALRAPDVTISVSQYRSFYVLGEVKTPGPYAYVPNMTVLTAVAMAGGFTYRAAAEEISVTRSAQGKPVESRATRESKVLPGDVVYVFERHL
jgi:polysaccharide biosynthesis/export protein